MGCRDLLTQDARFRYNHEEGKKMDAYRIDRFGSVDGIVLRSGSRDVTGNSKPGRR